MVYVNREDGSDDSEDGSGKDESDEEEDMQSDDESDTEDEKEAEEDEEEDEEEHNDENEEDYGREEEEGVDAMITEEDPNEIDGGYGVFEEEDPVEMMRKKEKRELRKQMKKKKEKVPKKSSKEHATATTGKYINSVRVNDIPVDGILNNPNMSGNETYNNSPGSYAAGFNPYDHIAAGDSNRERQRNGDERVEIPNVSVNLRNIEAMAEAASNIDITINDAIDIEAITNVLNDNHNTVSASITPAIKHRTKDKQFVITFLEKPKGKNSIFTVKPNILQAYHKTFYDAFYLKGVRYTMGEYIGSMKNIGMRRDPHDESSKYKRTSGQKKSIVDIFCYVTQYPMEMTYDAMVQDQHQIGAVMWTGVFGNSDRIKTLGASVVKEAQTTGGGLIRWILENKGGHEHDPETAAKAINQDVVDFFKDGFTWKTNVTLDYFMVDFDIKEFLMEKIGCTGWTDLSDAEKTRIYRNYPQKDLPNWDSLVKESY
jgi:hypothetical protein